MDLKLTGKKALVTGSSDGIGRAIALSLAGEGVAVVVHGRKAEKANAVASEIASNGGSACVVLGDLSSDAGAASVASGALAAFGGIDILVNNAGVYHSMGWQGESTQHWLELYNTNVASVVRLVGALAPPMKESGWGRIIQIGSGVAALPQAMMPAYSATKAAMSNLTVSLAKEMARTGVTVNTVSPGLIVTDSAMGFILGTAAQMGWGNTLEEVETRFAQEMGMSQTGRLGRVEDIASAVAYLASPLADFITGTNLHVDGGYVPTVN